jgi:hypothetical protein
MIRTTTNMICCLLFQASLPASYWAEALHTATHLLSHLPSKAVSHPTPYFAMYGTTPNYDHLRVFGCACYPNTSAAAPHKLFPRSTRCLFLGYSSDHKGYQCLDLASHRIIISRHVIFDEDVFPLASPSPSTDLDSLLESDPVSPSSQAPRLAPLPAPRATSTSRLAPILAPRAAPSTTLAPIPAPQPRRSRLCHARPRRPLLHHAWPRQRPRLASPTPRSSTTAVTTSLPWHLLTGPIDEPGALRHTRRRLSPPRVGHARGPRCPGRPPRATGVPPGRHPPRPWARPPDGDPARRRRSSTC